MIVGSKKFIKAYRGKLRDISIYGLPLHFGHRLHEAGGMTRI
jgi:hypothetical protein